MLDILDTVCRHLRYPMQTDLEGKNDTWEPENGLLGYSGPES